MSEQAPATVDALQRPILAEGMKRQIDQAFTVVPEGKRGALLIIAHEHGARAHLAAKIDDSGRWKVAAGGGVPWTGQKPTAWVGVMGHW